MIFNIFAGDLSLKKDEDSLYLSYIQVPKKIFVNQIFPVKIKIIVTEDSYQNLSYNFENGENIIPVYTEEPEIKDGIYLYKTFYFKALSTDVKLPDIVTYLMIDDFSPVKKEILKGKSLKAIKLNPPQDFCNVLAKSFKLKEYQAVQYDENQNLIVINVEANLSNLEDFHLDYVNKEGIEELNTTFPITNMTYFAIVPSYMKNFQFSYFNLNKNRFEKISKSIDVKDEIVSTQSDIRPSENSHKTVKIIIFLSLATLFLIIAIFKKSISVLLIALLFGGYAAYLSIPVETVCVKQNSKVSLLPTKNSTIFYITNYNFKTKKLNDVNGYIKIELPNGRIGWVKDEDICKN